LSSPAAKVSPCSARDPAWLRFSSKQVAGGHSRSLWIDLQRMCAKTALKARRLTTWRLD
jgi:hypothetical protein